ncbi:penicillin-binding transpeptidase domain-containing protein [Ellagibacter isourolithinifaciens]
MWFVGMAPSENCNVVVAIVIEKGQSSEYAASKARDVMKTALEVQGDL